MTIRIKRVYEAATPEDGYRVLVDRLWPRGVAKSDLVMDEWGKDASPSAELRKAWHHGDIDDAEFRSRYAAELEGNPAVVALAEKARKGTVTLLIAAKDVGRSHAHLLAQAIEGAQ
ncbi:MAG: DUF488 family protein [Ancrocorticia sp.]